MPFISLPALKAYLGREILKRPHMSVYFYVPPYNRWDIIFPSCPSVRLSVTLYGYHFACSIQQIPGLFDKLSCIHCNAHIMCTCPTLPAASNKYQAFSTNYHVYTAMPTLCAPVLLCLQHPTNTRPFQQIIMYTLQCPHYVHLSYFACSIQQIPGLFNKLSCIHCNAHIMCTCPTLPAASNKYQAFSTNYHVYTAMPTLCAPVLLCLQHPTNTRPFQQIIMYTLQCPHYVHLSYFACSIQQIPGLFNKLSCIHCNAHIMCTCPPIVY